MESFRLDCYKQLVMFKYNINRRASLTISSQSKSDHLETISNWGKVWLGSYDSRKY